jgi:hypothetical protein
VTAPASNALTLFQLFEAKAQAYLTAYDAVFQKAASTLGNEGAYAEQFIYQPSALGEANVQLVRLPVPLTAPELKLFKGRQHFQENGTGYIELQKAPYNGGVKEFLDRINAADWTGFSSAPEVFAGLVDAWPSQQCVSQLATAESTLSWDGLTNFLAATKYSNPYNTKMKLPGTSTLATYKNFWNGSVLNTTNVQLMRADMVKRRGFDNRPLGYRGTHLVSSSDLFPTAESVCLDERLANGATNPVFKYRLEPVCWYDLPPKRWGIIHLDKNRPVFAAAKGSPMTKVYGVDSAMFEKERKVGWNVFVQLGKGLARSESISIAVEP